MTIIGKEPAVPPPAPLSPSTERVLELFSDSPAFNGLVRLESAFNPDGMYLNCSHYNTHNYKLQCKWSPLINRNLYQNCEDILVQWAVLKFAIYLLNKQIQNPLGLPQSLQKLG